MQTKLANFAPKFLRIGIALVFIWFGSQQLWHPASWIGFIPKGIVSLSGLSVWTFVALNGSMEIVFGLALLFGFFTTISAFILAVHILFITLDVGYGPTGVRDFGIFIGSATVFLMSLAQTSIVTSSARVDADVRT